MTPAVVDTLDYHLQALAVRLQAANPVSEALQMEFLTAQQWFQQEVLGYCQGLTPAQQVQVQPLLTELNRTFRLAGMDIAFLQTARRSSTQQLRQRQLQQKVAQLRQFCHQLQAAVASA